MKKLTVLALLLSIFFAIPTIYPKKAFAQSQESVLSVPIFAQERNLSCEASAAKMILSFYGKDVPEAEILAFFGSNPNPYLGFRGNVDGKLGFINYGVYAPPVANSLTNYGVPSTVYSGIDHE